MAVSASRNASAPWIGASVVCDVEGYAVAGPAQGKPAVLLVEVDLDQASSKVISKNNDAFYDRRPRLYQE